MSVCCGENRGGRQKGTALCLCLRTRTTAHHQSCLYTLYPAQISRQRALNDDFWRSFLNYILLWEEITLCGGQGWDHGIIMTHGDARNSLKSETKLEIPGIRCVILPHPVRLIFKARPILMFIFCFLKCHPTIVCKQIWMYEWCIFSALLIFFLERQIRAHSVARIKAVLLCSMITWRLSWRVICLLCGYSLHSGVLTLKP